MPCKMAHFWLMLVNEIFRLFEKAERTSNYAYSQKTAFEEVVGVKIKIWYILKQNYFSKMYGMNVSTKSLEFKCKENKRLINLVS